MDESGTKRSDLSARKDLFARVELTRHISLHRLGKRRPLHLRIDLQREGGHRREDECSDS